MCGLSPVPPTLQDVLDETLSFIERALDRIRAYEGAEAELHNVPFSDAPPVA